MPALPSPGRILRVWFGLSIQSFGGGVATLALIRRAAVEQEGWISDAEFTRYWALCQIAPGINLLALTILIGRRIGGAVGVGAALFGLLFPSVTITILMTAAYARIRYSSVTQHALRGLLPATIGLGMVAAYQTARPLAVLARKEGFGSLLLSLLVLAGSAAAVAWARLPVIVVLLASGLIYALFSWLRPAASDPVPEKSAEAAANDPEPEEALSRAGGSARLDEPR